MSSNEIFLGSIPGVGGYEQGGESYDSVFVDGIADMIIRNADAAESEVGAAAVVSTAVQQMAAKPTLQRAVLQKVTPVLATELKRYAIELQNLRAFGWDDSPHQMIPIDSGDVLVAALGATPSFVITPNIEFVLTDMIVSEPMVDKFGLTTMKAGGFDYLSLGFSVTGNGTNACLTLAAFGSDWQIRRPLPFLGRKYSANTNLVIQGHEIQNVPNRFMMGIGVYFEGVCNSLLPPIIRRQMLQNPGYTLTARPKIPVPTAYNPILR